MTTRNFKQLGQAYGSTPASITATIDGTVVYSGTIPTFDTPIPSRPDVSTDSVTTLFTWTNTVEFAGTQSYSIAVTGSPLLLCFIEADYCIPNAIANFNIPYTYDYNGVTIADPLTNVAIDGVPQTRGPDNTLVGPWHWLIPAGSILTATLNVNAGCVPI